MGCALTCSLTNCKILVFSEQLCIYLWASLFISVAWLGNPPHTSHASLSWLLAELPMDLR